MEDAQTGAPPKAEDPASPSVAPGEASPRARSRSRGLAAFQYRNYRFYFAGQFATVIGMWMQSVALSWLVVATLGGSPFDLGMVNALNFLPTLLFGLYAGTIADRFNKRNLVNICQFVNFILAGTQTYLILTDRASINQVFLFALLLGLSNSLNNPARQALTSELVDKKDLMNAVALNSALFNAGRVIGPSIAGVLVAAFGPAVCFGINAASYLIGIGFYRGIKLPEGPRRQVAKVARGGVREGLAYVRRTDRILVPIALIGVVSIFAMSFNVWLPLLANDEFKIGASGYGLLMAVLGVGSLAGALNLAFFSDRPRFKVMFALAITLGLAEFALAISSSIPTSLWIALPLLAVVGFAMSTTAATANTIVQTSAPDAMRGRIMAIYMTVFNGVAPAGSLLTGTLADRFGAPVAVAICGSTAALLATAIWLYARTRDLRPRVVVVENGEAEPAPGPVAAPRSRDGRTPANAGRVTAMARSHDTPTYARDEAAED